MKIVERWKWLKRNPCKECVYYSIHHNTLNNFVSWCQSKKVSNNGNGKVTWIDKLFCHPYSGKKEERNDSE